MVTVCGHGIVRLPAIRGDENARGPDARDAAGDGGSVGEGPPRRDGTEDELYAHLRPRQDAHLLEGEPGRLVVGMGEDELAKALRLRLRHQRGDLLEREVPGGEGSPTLAHERHYLARLRDEPAVGEDMQALPRCLHAARL